MAVFVEATEFFVSVDGTDCSTRFASRLISLDAVDNSGETADTCRIVLDDTGGIIAMPEEGAHVMVSLNGGQVFDGIVDDVKSILDRGGGRRLEIEAKSADMKGKQKSPKRKHWDDKTIGDAMKDAAKEAGVDLTVCGRIAGIKRKYVAQDHESFLHFVTRLSAETGGTFKMIGGTRGVVLDRNQGETAGSGGSIGSVMAVVGDNLITANISPILTRPRFKEVRARWYDEKKAQWKEEKIQVEGIESSDGEALVRHSKKDADESKESGKSGGKESNRDKGAGTVIIDGTPAARAEGQCTVVGVRPGVDGTYTIDKAEHKLDRSNGYETTMTLKKPEDAKDSRGKDASGKRVAGKGGGGSGDGTGSGGDFHSIFTPP